MQPDTFKSIDSLISVSDSKITFKKVVSKEKSYWFHSLILLAILTYFNFTDLQDGVRKGSALIWSIMLVVWTFPHLEKIFTFLFFEKWGNSFLIKDILKIQILEPKNNFEQKVKIWTKSKRRKIVTFRTSEEQLEKFVETIKYRQPLLSSEIYGYS